jgi:hypothetical protein
MSKIGSWILEQEQLTEMHERSSNPERNELNEAYYEYLLLGYRNYFGSLDDLVCRYEGEQQHPSTHYSQYFAEDFE